MLTAPGIQVFDVGASLAAQCWHLAAIGTAGVQALSGPKEARPALLVPQAGHEGRSHRAVQRLKEIRGLQVLYRMGHGRGCSVAKLGAAEQVPSPPETREPQVPSVINISS